MYCLWCLDSSDNFGLRNSGGGCSLTDVIGNFNFRYTQIEVFENPASLNLKSIAGAGFEPRDLRVSEI